MQTSINGTFSVFGTTKRKGKIIYPFSLELLDWRVEGGAPKLTILLQVC